MLPDRSSNDRRAKPAVPDLQPRKERFMDAWEALLAGPRGDFPRGPAPSPALPWRPWIIVLLLVACLVPRAVAAWNWDVLWGDSLHYRYASISLEQGDFEQGFAEFGLNIYPLILIPLRHLGIDWQIAGKYFGVLVASLDGFAALGLAAANVRRPPGRDCLPGVCLARETDRHFAADHPRLDILVSAGAHLVLRLARGGRVAHRVLPGRRRRADARRPHADRGLAAADSAAGLGGVPLVHRARASASAWQSAPCSASP